MGQWGRFDLLYSLLLLFFFFLLFHGIDIYGEKEKKKKTIKFFLSPSCVRFQIIFSLSPPSGDLLAYFFKIYLIIQVRTYSDNAHSRLNHAMGITSVYTDNIERER